MILVWSRHDIPSSHCVVYYKILTSAHRVTSTFFLSYNALDTDELSFEAGDILDLEKEGEWVRGEGKDI